MTTLKIAHKGAPCDPPIVDGVTFSPLDGSDLYVGEATQEQADLLLRIDAFKLYGGAKTPQAPPPPAGDGDGSNPLPTDAEVDALTAKAAAVALGAAHGVTVTAGKLADQKVELKAAFGALRQADAQV